MFNAIRYLRDRRIRYWTEGKNVSAGWVNLCCPLCRDDSNHGGFRPTGGYSCWICGKHSVEDVIMALEKIPYPEACRIVMEYDDELTWRPPSDYKKPQGLDGNLGWPPGTMPLQEPHREYLRKRNFDPDFLAQKYGLKGTGGIGSYSWRIIVPIFLDGQMVSYQGRDITGKHELRYKACRKELELVDHKTILYNIDNCQGEAAICVEGVTDVWRLGDDTFGTFGTSVTQNQVTMMAARFRKVFVMSDAESHAQKRAKRLCGQLSVQGTEVTNIALDKGDPADLDQEEADDMKKNLLSGYN